MKRYNFERPVILFFRWS